MSAASEVPPLEVVYVLGNSFSGSTVLGFLMAGAPEVLCLGELKMHSRGGSRICSCGQTGTACSFWSRWEGHRIYSGGSWAKLKLSLRLLLGLPVRAGGPPSEASDDLPFLRQMWRETGEPLRLIDTSKSLWRLAHLYQTRGINVRVIHVRRQLHGTVASFVKRFGGFWGALARCLANDLLCRRFFALHPDVRHLEVWHERLCSDPDAVMKDIGDFIGVDYGGYLRHLETLEIHVRGGNHDTIKQKWSGLKLRSPQEEEGNWRSQLAPHQIRLLNWLAPRQGSRARITAGAGAPAGPVAGNGEAA